MRSRCRCSKQSAIHINSHSWLRSSSTHEPSDPPHTVVQRLPTSVKRRDSHFRSTTRALTPRQGIRRECVHHAPSPSQPLRPCQQMIRFRRCRPVTKAPPGVGVRGTGRMVRRSASAGLILPRNRLMPCTPATRTCVLPCRSGYGLAPLCHHHHRR